MSGIIKDHTMTSASKALMTLMFSDQKTLPELTDLQALIEILPVEIVRDLARITNVRYKSSLSRHEMAGPIANKILNPDDQVALSQSDPDPTLERERLLMLGKEYAYKMNLRTNRVLKLENIINKLENQLGVIASVTRGDWKIRKYSPISPSEQTGTTFYSENGATRAFRRNDRRDSETGEYYEADEDGVVPN